MSESKNYYAIIPANVRYDKRLPANAKLLYGEITALCNEKGFCWAGDKYFADLYGVSKVSIQKWLKALQENGYITKELIYKEGSKEILHRYIRLVVYPIQEKLSNPTQEKFRDNNTSINNTINNTVNNDDDALKEIFKLYEKTFGVLNSINVQSIQYWCEDLSAELMLEALKRSRGVQSFKYTEGILKKWEAKGVKNMSDVAVLDSEFKKIKSSKKHSIPDSELPETGLDW
ncbi:DnaD and phage-associated domain-containing protein [Enterococcus malodoratus]|uniref:DnaD domain protein n=1 Tax=Enterococcus malodoratus TaxID=71451 RepID=UPI0008AB97D1|nr:DnaD domain protein [Enterococcus malodoratus]SET33811.1 DnaD and phage-associated domain-containing protein [Enterococcus malodoratus]